MHGVRHILMSLLQRTVKVSWSIIRILHDGGRIACRSGRTRNSHRDVRRGDWILLRSISSSEASVRRFTTHRTEARAAVLRQAAALLIAAVALVELLGIAAHLSLLLASPLPPEEPVA